MEKKYSVTIALKVSECAGENHVEMMNVELDYHNLPYTGVVDIEQLMIGVVNKLGEMGVDRVEANAEKMRLAKKKAAV